MYLIYSIRTMLILLQKMKMMRKDQPLKRNKEDIDYSLLNMSFLYYINLYVFFFFWFSISSFFFSCVKTGSKKELNKFNIY